MSVLEVALDSATVILAVDSDKAFHRVWISNGAGMLAEPMTLPVSREDISQLERALNELNPVEPAIAIETTGRLHRQWVSKLERRHPVSMRLFAPAETVTSSYAIRFGQVQER